MDKENKINIDKLTQTYELLESLAARAIDLSAKQLEGRISHEDAKAELYVIAEAYCDLSETEEAKIINDHLRNIKSENGAQKEN